MLELDPDGSSIKTFFVSPPLDLFEFIGLSTEKKDNQRLVFYQRAFLWLEVNSPEFNFVIVETS